MTAPVMAASVALLLSACASGDLTSFPSAPTSAEQKALSRFDTSALRAEYGAPDFVRKEIDSELWRYDAAPCAAFFFLYRDGAAYRLRYIETQPRGSSDAVDEACLARVRTRVKPIS